MGIPNSKDRGTTPKPPIPLYDVDLHLIQQCLGPLHAPPQTAAPTFHALSPIASNSSIGYIIALRIRPQNYPFSLTDNQTQLPASSLDPSGTSAYHAKHLGLIHPITPPEFMSVTKYHPGVGKTACLRPWQFKIPFRSFPVVSRHMRL